MVASAPLVLTIAVSLAMAGEATRDPEGSALASKLAPAPAAARSRLSAANIPAADSMATADTLHLTPIADRHAENRPPLESVARGLGLENVTVDHASSPLRIAYENRRFRHSADAYGWLERGGVRGQA